MPTISLQHCIPVVIYSSGVPADVSLVLAAGGLPGDGTVDVIVGPNGPDPPDSLPTGSGDQFQAPVCLVISVHYRMEPGGSPTVPVTYSYHVS